MSVLDTYYPIGTPRQNKVCSHVFVGDSIAFKVIDGVNLLTEWCARERVFPQSFNKELNPEKDTLWVYVNGVQI